MAYYLPWRTMTFLIVIVLFSSCIQLYFWVIQLDALYRSSIVPEPKSVEDLPSVTLVIAVQNELANLKTNINHWLEQGYPALSIIIVNDHSSDDSLAYLEAIDDKRLRILDLPKGKSTKKWALTHGIASSTSEWIVTTDADCTPASENWISTLMCQAKDADVILGYSPHRYIGGWLSQWIDYETWYIATQYLSATLMGRPYMSVGRNVAFKKEQFDQIGGFNSHMHVRSGDDDLLINEIGRKARYKAAIDSDAWVWTEAKCTWGAYFQQKRRHLSTAPHYSFWNQVWLMLVYMSQLAWYVAVIWLTLVAPMFGVLFLFRWVILMLVAHRSKKVLDLNVSILLVPVFDIFLCLFYGVMSVTMLQKNKGW